MENKISLKKKISLAKKMVGEEVKKQKISAREARVVFVLDHSRSMAGLYNNGTVQRTLERIFPLAMHFDDNGEMEFYLFDTHFKELDPVTEGNLEKYTEEIIMKKRGHYGATNYAPVIREITERYGVLHKSPVPTFTVFITDGNNGDKKEAKAAITDASRYNIFWKFVGIGDEKFEFLEKLDTMEGRFIDNANFIKIDDLEGTDDRVLYQLLLTEFGDWCGLCRERGMIGG